MLEILAVGLLLSISIFLAYINWRIFKVTLLMFDVTVKIYCKTITLLEYTQKTYEILGGDADLTSFPKDVKLTQTKNTVDLNQLYQEVEDG
jgi:hypothetical protein